MMPMHSWSHETGESTLGLFGAALKSWMLCVATSFCLVASRQNFLPPLDDLVITRQLDALTLAAVAIATAMLFLRKRYESATRWQVLAVGIFWVALSIISKRAYPLLMEDRHTLKFLLAVMMGDSDPLHGWVWRLFLIAQLTALPALKFLRGGLLRLRTTGVAGQH